MQNSRRAALACKRQGACQALPFNAQVFAIRDIEPFSATGNVSTCFKLDF
jgi:hypothetical protein